MRAYELIQETFLRRRFIAVIHLIWLAFYGLFWWLFLPDPEEYGRFLLLWGGFVLPLALSAGILGDDIASGRICVLVTKPFWAGDLYVYRLIGLSLQAAVQFLLAALLVFILHAITRRSSISGLGRWLFASWLLFNTVAALSTSVSVVVKRAHNSLLLLVTFLTGAAVAQILISTLGNHPLGTVVAGLFRYPFPPFELLRHLAKGDYARESLSVGSWRIPTSIACVGHSLLLTVLYAGAGIALLTHRQFSGPRD